MFLQEQLTLKNLFRRNNMPIRGIIAWFHISRIFCELYSFLYTFVTINSTKAKKHVGSK
jgi:hypothetical protein